MSEREELILIIGKADGQIWETLADAPSMGEFMYGKQADAILASGWLAERDAAIEKRARAIGTANAARAFQGSLSEAMRGYVANAGLNMLNAIDRAAAHIGYSSAVAAMHEVLTQEKEKEKDERPHDIERGMS